HPCATDCHRSDSPFDLHVLGPPQTFALSQDQTLQFDCFGCLPVARPKGLWNVSSRRFRCRATRVVDRCRSTSPRAVSVAEANRTVRFVVRVPALQFSGSEGPVSGKPRSARRGGLAVLARTLRRRGFGSLGQRESPVKSFGKKNSAAAKMQISSSQVLF